MLKKLTKNNSSYSIQNKINKKIIFIFALAVFTIRSVTPNSFAYAENDQNSIDAITDIEFRTMTDFHTYLPNSQMLYREKMMQTS